MQESRLSVTEYLNVQMYYLANGLAHLIYYVCLEKMDLISHFTKKCRPIIFMLSSQINKLSEKSKATKPQKEMTALAQKQANVAGAFALKGDVRGKQILLVDDLYDSGATLAEAARVLACAGVTRLVVLTLTKTIHADA